MSVAQRFSRYVSARSRAASRPDPLTKRSFCLDVAVLRQRPPHPSSVSASTRYAIPVGFANCLSVHRPICFASTRYCTALSFTGLRRHVCCNLSCRWYWNQRPPILLRAMVPVATARWVHFIVTPGPRVLPGDEHCFEAVNDARHGISPSAGRAAASVHSERTKC